MFIGRIDAEAETPILRPPDAKNRLIGKDPDAGEDWRREKKGMTEDEMVGWHRRLNGHEFQQAPWVGDGQGDLACCSPWGWKEPDTTEWLNWTELNWQVQISAETTSLSFKTGNSYRTRNSQCSSLMSEEFSYLGKVSLLSIQAFSGLDEVHPHYGGQSVLFSLLTELLILSKNTLTQTPLMSDKTYGYPVIQSSWHINYHIWGN